MSLSRRRILAGLGLTGLGAVLPSFIKQARADQTEVTTGQCPFRLSVINNEISTDFERACHVAAVDFGLQWIELRAVWGKDLTILDDKEIGEVQKILAKYNLRVTDIASQLYKTYWPGAPRSEAIEQHGESDNQSTADDQEKLLERCIALAKTFQTDRIRCFDFWRLSDQKPYRAAINKKLREAAARCAKDNIILLLENETECNTATGAEAAAVLQSIPDKNFMLNWDPGNSATFPGNVPYPADYDLLPKHRIGHCHCKDTIRPPEGKFKWAPVGGGIVDWVGQFRAFARDGYRHAISLETHWRGGVPPVGSGMGVPEASSRVSMDGLKKALGEAGVHC